jgi:hypothetical protein
VSEGNRDAEAKPGRSRENAVEQKQDQLLSKQQEVLSSTIYTHNQERKVCTGIWRIVQYLIWRKCNAVLNWSKFSLFAAGHTNGNFIQDNTRRFHWQ